MSSKKQTADPTGRSVLPGEVARVLEQSIVEDLAPRTFLPQEPVDVQTLARWGHLWGLEAPARRSWAAAARLHARRGDPAAAEEARLKAQQPGRFTEKDLAEWIETRVSPWPERFRRLAEELKRVETKVLSREVERLDACGHPWGRVVRLFWRGARGEFSRTYGLHRCKSRHCPHCGRRKQGERSEEIERVLELAREWGLGPENVRFLTLTVRNGADIPTLRKKAHKAWAKLQRRRWWPRWVAMWFRGTECVTGEDGNWNFHLHVVLVLWAHRVSYQHLWDEWESAVGERSQIDIDRLHSEKVRKARHRGGIAAAARYVVKYIGKAAEVRDLSQGPGGFAHYASAMNRLRAFAMGGAATVLRRLAGILLPGWARRLEGILEDAHLWNGMPPVRAEEIDTETGEVIPNEPLSPALDAKERAQAVALAMPLLQMGGTVGEPCGPKGRWRRIGAVPLPSPAPRMRDFLAALQGHARRQRADHHRQPRTLTEIVWRKGKPIPLRVAVRTSKQEAFKPAITGVRALIADGAWRIEHVKETTKEGKPLRYRVILPAARFAWRDVAHGVWRVLGQDVSRWAQRRGEAFRAWAEAKVGALDRRDDTGLLVEGLHQAERGARIEANRFDRELDQERRKEVSDPELVAWLTDMRDFLRRSPFRKKKTNAWAEFDFALLGI